MRESVRVWERNVVEKNWIHVLEDTNRKYVSLISSFSIPPNQATGSNHSHLPLPVYYFGVMSARFVFRTKTERELWAFDLTISLYFDDPFILVSTTFFVFWSEVFLSLSLSLFRCVFGREKSFEFSEYTILDIWHPSCWFIYIVGTSFYRHQQQQSPHCP